MDKLTIDECNKLKMNKLHELKGLTILKKLFGIFLIVLNLK